MTTVDTSRRGFLKSAVAASAAMMTAAAANAGIPASSVAKYDEEFDVVIVGSGFAGMACALKAGRAGLKVLMIEKMVTVGGNSAICGGNVACPVNPVQKAQGIKDSKELFIADCLKDGLGINHPNLLIASHIKPWAVSSNKERLSVDNGLLLSATYDRLFDSGLITFDRQGKIFLSSLIGEGNVKRLNLSNDMRFDLCVRGNMGEYLDYHNDVVFVK